MLKISREFVQTVSKARTAGDLACSLQKAIELEHSTIPPYLTALYSLKSGSNEAIADTLRDIVLDEMLHMAIASNILVAIGGTPRIKGPGFVPRYPGPLPMCVSEGLQVGLTPISRDAIENTYMEIEKPKNIRNFPVAGLMAEKSTFSTIGEFYEAVKQKIIELGDGIFIVGSERQVLNLQWPREEKLFAIDSATVAIQALDIIVRQGEGTDASPLTFSGRASHYYRFEEILRGRMLVTDDTVADGFSFSGDVIDFDETEIWNIPSNPKLADYAEGSPERAAAAEFAQLYTELLTVLDQAFAGEPARAQDSVLLMHRLGVLGRNLASRGIGLVFEYTPSETLGFAWRPTNAPVASSRTDDIWFVDDDTGWAVNSNGQILKTVDGGATWSEQLHLDVYWRCIAFADSTVGWAGSLTDNNRLYATRNGGTSWERVSNLPDLPTKICGMTVVDAQTVICTGTNEPSDRTAGIVTRDGGATWTIWDLGEHATLLVDNYFVTADRGWIVGGRSDRPNPTRRDVIPVVLYTEDGGVTWRDLVADMEGSFKVGEWGWKIHFVNDQTGFISLEAFDWAAILRSDDGGMTWERFDVNDPDPNANIEGIGFVNEKVGWVGGWGDANFVTGQSSSSHDGGHNWQDANAIGRFVNRFRFIGNPLRVGYSSGWTVYKYSKDPVPPPLMPNERRLIRENEPMQVRGDLDLPVTIPAETRRLRVDTYDRFGAYAASVLDEFGPTPGNRTVRWDFSWRRGRKLDPGTFIIRVTVDGTSESQLVRYLGHGDTPGNGDAVKVNSYAEFRALLDEIVGGADEPVRVHGPFWRTMTRDEVVAGSYAGVDYITPGDSNASGIIKAFRGEAPFGADVGTPGARFRRMPAGGGRVDEEKIEAIAKWIDDGAPE